VKGYEITDEEWHVLWGKHLPDKPIKPKEERIINPYKVEKTPPLPPNISQMPMDNSKPINPVGSGGDG